MADSARPGRLKPHHRDPRPRLRLHPELVRQGRHLRFDRAVLLTGKAADDASAAHGGESPVPNDLYIQNDNPRLREVVVADQPKVIGSQQLTGSPGPNPSSLKALLTFIHQGGPQAAATPFHLKYDDNGFVTQVQEQYLPYRRTLYGLPGGGGLRPPQGRP